LNVLEIGVFGNSGLRMRIATAASFPHALRAFSCCSSNRGTTWIISYRYRCSYRRHVNWTSTQSIYFTMIYYVQWGLLFCTLGLYNLPVAITGATYFVVLMQNTSY